MWPQARQALSDVVSASCSAFKTCIEAMPLDCTSTAVSRNDTARQLVNCRKAFEKIAGRLVPTRQHLQVNIAGRESVSEEPGPISLKGVLDDLPLLEYAQSCLLLHARHAVGIRGISP